MTKPNKPQSGESPGSDESDDIALISFLRANRPPVPEPGLGLEGRLMQAISKEPLDAIADPQPSRPRYRWNGAVAACLGLGAIALGLGQLPQWYAPPGLSSAELAQLESFMVNNWDESVPSTETIRDWDWLDEKAMPVSSADASDQNSNASPSDPSQP